jgi:hypothetical protein
MDNGQAIQEKLDTIIELLQSLLALELSRNRVPRDIIGKRLHVAKSTVVKMLKGIKIE